MNCSTIRPSTNPGFIAPARVRSTEKYTLVLFRPRQNHDLAFEYCRLHAKALAAYKCSDITTNNDEWMHNPAAYAIAALDSRGRMVSGVRLHLSHKDFPLPLETAVAEFDSSIVDTVKAKAGTITGEVCALWTSDSISGKGFGLLMTRAATAHALRLGATSLFGFASPATYKLLLSLGYTRVATVGRNGDFLYPTADYISTVMMIPDLAALLQAAPWHRERMLSICRTPLQTCEEGTAKKIVIDYRLSLAQPTAFGVKQRTGPLK